MSRCDFYTLISVDPACRIPGDLRPARARVPGWRSWVDPKLGRATPSSYDMLRPICVTFQSSNWTASTCDMPQTLSGWLSDLFFFGDFTVLCGLLLCWDVITWWFRLCKPRDDDLLRGFGCLAILVFATFYRNPSKKISAPRGKALNKL